MEDFSARTYTDMNTEDYSWYAKMKRYTPPDGDVFSTPDISAAPNENCIAFATEMSVRLTTALRSARKHGIVPTDVTVRWRNTPDGKLNPLADRGYFDICIHGLSEEDSKAIQDLPELKPIK